MALALKKISLKSLRGKIYLIPKWRRVMLRMLKAVLLVSLIVLMSCGEKESEVAVVEPEPVKEKLVMAMVTNQSGLGDQ